MTKIVQLFSINIICILALSPPTPPELTVTYAGDVMKATCLVVEGDPAPNITWFLGEEEVQQDPEDAPPASDDDPWEWPSMVKATSKTLTRALRPEDSGKLLKCSVTHEALTRPLEATEVVRDVKGKAKAAKAKAKGKKKETTEKDTKPTEKKKETKDKDANSTDKKKKTKGKDAKSTHKKKEAKSKDGKSPEIKRVVVNKTPKVKMTISRDEL